MSIYQYNNEPVDIRFDRFYSRVGTTNKIFFRSSNDIVEYRFPDYYYDQISKIDNIVPSLVEYNMDDNNSLSLNLIFTGDTSFLTGNPSTKVFLKIYEAVSDEELSSSPTFEYEFPDGTFSASTSASTTIENIQLNPIKEYVIKTFYSFTAATSSMEGFNLYIDTYNDSVNSGSISSIENDDSYFATFRNPPTPIIKNSINFGFTNISDAGTARFSQTVKAVSGQTIFPVYFAPLASPPIRIQINGVNNGFFNFDPEDPQKLIYDEVAALTPLLTNDNVTFVYNVNYSALDLDNLTYYDSEIYDVSVINSGDTPSSSDIVFFNTGTTFTQYEYYLKDRAVNGNDIEFYLNGVLKNKDVDYLVDVNDSTKLLFFTGITFNISDRIQIFFTNDGSINPNKTSVNLNTFQQRPPKIKFSVSRPIENGEEGEFTFKLSLSTDTGFTTPVRVDIIPYEENKVEYEFTFPTSGAGINYIYKIENNNRFDLSLTNLSLTGFSNSIIVSADTNSGLFI
jgi:hypothetical protein